MGRTITELQENKLGSARPRLLEQQRPPFGSAQCELLLCESPRTRTQLRNKVRSVIEFLNNWCRSSTNIIIKLCSLLEVVALWILCLQIGGHSSRFVLRGSI